MSSDPEGFEADLDELNRLANADVPFIEQSCTDAGGTVWASGRNDDTIFDGPLYTGLAATFAQTRSGLANLLAVLSGSLAECGTALREIHRRYRDCEEENVIRYNRIGSTL